MEKTITIIVQNAPYKSDNKAWHALRFAGAALATDMNVRVHLLDDGVNVGRKDQQAPDGAVHLGNLLAELMQVGLTVRACGMALDGCGIQDGDLLDGIERGSMKLLADWIKSSDSVLTF